MELNRIAYQYLLKWKDSANRKPLIIRGARQVGKTTLIRQFAKEFDSFIELNLERTSDAILFENDNIDNILNAAFLMKGVTPKGSTILLFIDEIQESTNAIKLLRYFYEEKPDLHVIAAGSLLEFVMAKVKSFPVGRVEFYYLHPLNFMEYLEACPNKNAINAFDIIPIPEYAHHILLQIFHEYLVVGGMPEIVREYLISRNIASLSRNYKMLWEAYLNDIEKYAHNETERRIIRHVIHTAPAELSRIKFEKFGNSNYRSREVGEALRALDLSRIIQLIYPSTSIDPPIITDFKKRPRLQFLDTGMLNQVLQIQADLITGKDLNTYYKGRIIEHLVCQELISINEGAAFKPHFWVRKEKDSSSEVDLLFQTGKYVIPIEVKSGKQGTLRSLHQFVDRSSHPYAIRLYAGLFSIERTVTPSGTPYFLMNLPYYLGTKIPDYIQYLIANFKL